MPTLSQGVVLAGLILGAGSAAHAADVYKGTIAGDAQIVSFTHGLAWIDAKHRVSVGLYQRTPDEKENARALQGGGSIFGVFDAPNTTLELSFKDGATRAQLASFESCHINFSRFEIGIFDWNAFAGGCGPVEFSGDLKGGSVVHGKLKGKAKAYPRKDGTRPTYTWDVDFTVTLAAKP